MKSVRKLITNSKSQNGDKFADFRATIKSLIQEVELLQLEVQILKLKQN